MIDLSLHSRAEVLHHLLLLPDTVRARGDPRPIVKCIAHGAWDHHHINRAEYLVNAPIAEQGLHFGALPVQTKQATAFFELLNLAPRALFNFIESIKILRRALVHRIELLRVSAVWILCIDSCDPFHVVRVVSRTELKVPDSNSELEPFVYHSSRVIGVVSGDCALVNEGRDYGAFPNEQVLELGKCEPDRRTGD